MSSKTKRKIEDYFTQEAISSQQPVQQMTRAQQYALSKSQKSQQGSNFFSNLISSIFNQSDTDGTDDTDDTAALNKAVMNMNEREAERVKLEKERMQSTKGGSSDDTAALNKAVMNMNKREVDRLKLERERMSVPLTSPIFNQTLYPNPVYKDPLDYSGSPPAFDREPTHGGLSAPNYYAGTPPAFDREPAHGGFIPPPGKEAAAQTMIPTGLPMNSYLDGMPEQPRLTLAQRGVNPNAVYPLQGGTVTDQWGRPVRSGNKSVMGLPTQNAAYQAPAGGKGANATPQSAIDQLTGIKGFGGK